MRRVLEFIGVNAFLAAVIGAMVLTYVAAYSVVAWLDLPDPAHGALAICAVALAVAAGWGAAKTCDRLLNPRVIRRRP